MDKTDVGSCLNMKELFFNDISVYPLCSTDDEVAARIGSFVEILKFCNLLGFKEVRYETLFTKFLLKDNFTLHDYISKHNHDVSCNLILSMMHKPYIKDGSEAEEKYVNSIVRLCKDSEKVEAEGLACAHLSKGFAVGFASDNYWKDNISFQLIVTNQTTNSSVTERVFCISDVSQFDKQDFIDWAVVNIPIKFKKCDTAKEKKHCHLRDDHGKEKLKHFADRLLKEDYIIEVVNSLPFNSHATDMIGKITEDGYIDIIDTDTDAGYGLVIKTTADSKMLAKYMAADIKNKYS